MKIGRIILRLLGFLLIFATWQVAGSIRASPALPSPLIVLQTVYILMRDGTLWPHIGSSLSIILRGIGFAVAFGFVIGVFMFQYKNFRIATLPIIESVRGVAALTLFPLLIVFFGIGASSRIFIIFWTAWPAMALSTMASLDIDKSIVEAAMDFGAKPWRIMFTIRLPLASKGILTGIRIGVGGGWIGLVAAEMLGATRGLGYFLLWSAQSFQFARVYAVIIVIAIIGGLMNLILLILQKNINKIIGVE